MKKVLLIGAIALSLSFLFMNFNNKASADDFSGKGYGRSEGFSGMRRGLEVKAEFLGISVEDLQSQMAEGKTMLEIAEEQGVNFDDLKDYMLTKAQERWSERGLTEEEINERLQWMQEKHENCTGDHSQQGSPWRGKGRGFNKNQ